MLPRTTDLGCSSIATEVMAAPLVGTGEVEDARLSSIPRSTCTIRASASSVPSWTCVLR